MHRSLEKGHVRVAYETTYNFCMEPHITYNDDGVCACTPTHTTCDCDIMLMIMMIVTLHMSFETQMYSYIVCVCVSASLPTGLCNFPLQIRIEVRMLLQEIKPKISEQYRYIYLFNVWSILCAKR